MDIIYVTFECLRMLIEASGQTLKSQEQSKRRLCPKLASTKRTRSLQLKWMKRTAQKGFRKS
ncbi:unnamed protein product [Oikopleura dioica]|uniref:Uncharacterized protein n=1 Tax=Oikopleura dioica TaxID=34765 RepID=E4YB05_OIKDI|nr:unnamed protein product [Oikopleura dioica]